MLVPRIAGCDDADPVNESDGPIVTAQGVVSDDACRIESDNALTVGAAPAEIGPESLDRKAIEAVLDQATPSCAGRSIETNVGGISEMNGSKSEIRVEMVAGDRNRHDFKWSSRP